MVDSKSNNTVPKNNNSHTVNNKKNSNNIICGFTSGLIVTGLLNPWDKALYLSVKENRKFLSPQNFIRPYEGVIQTAVQRSISSGIWFPLNSYFQSKFSNYKSEYSGDIFGL